MHTLPAGSIFDQIELTADNSSDCRAFLSLDRSALTYAGLTQLTANTRSRLNELGIGRNDRVAVVLPNGPEMATAFLAVAAAATCAPLNPAFPRAEFEFYMDDLQPKALITLRGLESPARTVAVAEGIAVVELDPSATTAGEFDLSGPSQPLMAQPGAAQADDIALVLSTSGTTSRPKQVPLTHTNLLASAYSVVKTLELTPHDRCLNVMPLFHIHGLSMVVLASVTAGASVVCTPGFDAQEFFEWLNRFKPTWYSAVPTMHQAILQHSAVYHPSIANHSLRFIRSESSPLPPQVLLQLERAFGVPVNESFGMTEAGQQITSNPLPPKPRKPGSVGPAAGPQVAIMDPEGSALLPAHTQGEVVIRGSNVIAGYANNPHANATGFVDGWFRTGDQGYLDEDGYLFLTGRLKEIINRGGEKISPREVDEVLLSHPDVLQATTFAVPHPQLGEEVAAAIVLQPGAAVSERLLQRFAIAQLAEFKVPRRILIVDDMPTGPTGKPQRIGLAEKLGLARPARSAPRMAPRTPTERYLANAWCEVLGLQEISVFEPFVAAGGDSLRAMRLVTRVREKFDIDLHIVDLFAASTIAAQAEVIETLLEERRDGHGKTRSPESERPV